MNNRGQVVVSTGGNDTAFLWEGGEMRNLGALPGGDWRDGESINDRG
jgi:probable HAF family extracellular repeat protein